MDDIASARQPMRCTDVTGRRPEVCARRFYKPRRREQDFSTRDRNGAEATRQRTHNTNSRASPSGDLLSLTPLHTSAPRKHDLTQARHRNSSHLHMSHSHTSPRSSRFLLSSSSSLASCSSAPTSTFACTSVATTSFFTSVPPSSFNATRSLS